MTRMLLSMLLALIVTATASVSAHAASETDRNYQVLQDRPDRIVAVLPNRMIIIAQRMSAAPVVSAQIWVKTGSIYEQEHVGAGLSHFLEHLVSGGSTTTRTEVESNAILGSIGGQTNAATSLDTVRYYINSTSNHAEQVIALLSDWLANSKIIDSEYARERDVIQREFEMGMGDPGRIHWKLSQTLRYPQAHPARHPTIGYIDEFMTITRDEIYDFYKRMYVPNNMVFVVAGDIEPRKTVDQIAGIWGEVKPGSLPKLVMPAGTPEKMPSDGEAYADIARPRVRLMWPNAPLGSADDYALDVLGIILGSGESSRLVKSLRNEQQIVTSIDAFNYSVPWGEAFFGVDAEVADFVPDDAAVVMDAEPQAIYPLRCNQVERSALAQIEDIQHHGITDAELARAKRMVIAYVLQAAQTADGMAGRLARDVINHQDPDYLARYAKAIEAVTKQQVQTVAKTYLVPEKLLTATLLPLEKDQQVEVQRRPEAISTQNDDSTTKSINLDNQPLIAELKNNLKDGGVDAPTLSPLQRFTLDNGLRLIVQQSDLVPAVSMQAYVLGGLLGDEPGREGVASTMASMLRRGTASYAADELSEKLDSLGASISTAGGNNTWYVQASALKEDWPTVYGMMAEVMTRPTFPKDEWQRLQPRLLAAIDRQESRWSGELGARFRETFFKGHPWSQTPLGRREVIEDLTVEQLAAYHQRHLDPAKTVIAIVGDITVDQVKQLTEQHFGSIPARTETAFSLIEPNAPSSKLVIHPTDKPTTAVQIGFGPGIARTDEDYAAMQVLSRVMSDFPAGYLHRALRGEGKGLVYAAWGYPRVGVVPGSYEIAFNTSAGDVPEAVAAALGVVARMKAGEFNEGDLQRAKAKLLTGEMMSKQSNADRATEYAIDELYGVDQTLEQYLEAVNAVTAADVQRVAKQYLINPVVVVISKDQVDQAAVEAVIKDEMD